VVKIALPVTVRSSAARVIKRGLGDEVHTPVYERGSGALWGYLVRVPSLPRLGWYCTDRVGRTVTRRYDKRGYALVALVLRYEGVEWNG